MFDKSSIVLWVFLTLGDRFGPSNSPSAYFRFYLTGCVSTAQRSFPGQWLPFWAPFDAVFDTSCTAKCHEIALPSPPSLSPPILLRRSQFSRAPILTSSVLADKLHRSLIFSSSVICIFEEFLRFLEPEVLINHFNHRGFCTPGINNILNPFQPIVLPFKRKEGRGVFPVAGIPADHLSVHNRHDMGLCR